MMTLASPVTLLLLASAPGVLLVVLGVVPSIRRKVHRTISATAIATGLALLVLVLLVVVGYSLDALSSVTDSQLILLGVPLASFATALGVLAHRSKLTLPSAAAGGIVGIIGLWYLGGLVLMLSACSFSSGGC